MRMILPVLLTVALVIALPRGEAVGGTLTVQSTNLGSTPDILGYNLGHFYPGSNTREWWRYAGVTGARMFINPAEIETSDDIAPWGDGVTNQTSFLNRKTALRANPLSSTYINWSYINGKYQNNDLYSTGGSHILTSNALAQLRSLNIQVLAQITGGPSTLPITSSSDWAGKWEFWQHYYAQAFYLSRHFDVRRFQMYNEPDLDGISTDDYLMRLQLASDAIQSAIADVNALYGKSLSPLIFAPITAHSTADYTGWGDLIVTNRHVNFLGQPDSNFWLIHRYDFHQYSTTSANFSNSLVGLNSLIDADMTETPFPVCMSEFNTRTGANFDNTSNTLDTPSEYAAFGSIAVNLLQATNTEFYCFKFSQTERTGGTYPVAKNGVHYVENYTAPYNIGGVTKAGEVWRLFNKGLAPGRALLGYTRSGTTISGLDIRVSRDPTTQRYYLFSVNDSSSSSATVTVNTVAWSLPVSNKVLVEEVSENRYGGGRIWGTIATNQTVSDGTTNVLVQPPNSVWLFTLPAIPQDSEQVIVASDDALVKDGSNATNRYGTNLVLWVKNNSTNTNARNASFIKFHLPAIAPAEIQLAVLSVQAATINGAGSAQAHVYGLTNNDWSETNITWAIAPNLAQGVTAGGSITNNFVQGVGSNATLIGQLVAGSTAAERLIDVTDYLRTQTNSTVTFLLAREVRFENDTQENDGIEIVSREGDLAMAARLRVVNQAHPKITSVGIVAGGGFKVEWISVPGLTNTVFRSTDLTSTNWVPLYSALGTGNLMECTDSSASSSTASFYRVGTP
jgi:hypothetical protein